MQINLEAEATFTQGTNRIYGIDPDAVDVEITFKGENNILWCEEGTRFDRSLINFTGSNALVCIGKSRHAAKLVIDVWSNATFCIGSNYYINGTLHAIASERQSILIGDDALFSFGIWMRTADPHLIYRCSDGARINPSRPIVLGDHVWVGQGAMILKGSSIGSGAILGGGAVCAGKTIPSNTSWAGNPAKQLAKGVFFTKDSVHNYSAEQTEQSQHSKLKKFTYKPSADTIESPMKATAVQLSEVASADEKLELVQALFGNTAKSRFAIHEKPAPKPEPKPEPKKKSFARRAVGKAKRMLKG